MTETTERPVDDDEDELDPEQDPDEESEEETDAPEAESDGDAEGETDGDGDAEAEGDGDGDGDGDGGGGGGGGARGKFKFMNIFETQDVGVPLRVAYDQWTQFADFPSFMKKVETVNQESDEKSIWTAKVFWSRRSWDTTIREQIPDSHIVWVSSGAKGHADGCVSFSELAPNLTRIVLILEYYPQGFFEKTGNLWRAVGRRARLEFKHFCRTVMMDTLLNRDDLEGWRGEIRDSEVVRTHEEAMEEEQAAAEEAEDSDVDDEDGFDAEDELADDELADDELADDEATDDDLDEPEAADADAEDLDETEDARRTRGRRRDRGRRRTRGRRRC